MKPKIRIVHHLWPWTKKTATFSGGAYRLEWDEKNQAWTVQFHRVAYVLQTTGKRNLTTAALSVDLYHEDPTLTSEWLFH